MSSIALGYSPAKSGVSASAPLPFYVTAYGAKGDGVTDDTDAIQAAIDAAYTASGTAALVWLPPGTFRCSALNLKCSLDGPGILKAIGGTSDSTQFVQVPVSYDGVTIRNVTLDGNLQGAGATYDDYTGTKGLQIYANNVTVEGVTIQNVFGAGIHGAGIARASLIGNRITKARGEFGDGIYLAGSVDAVIVGNHIEDFTRIGIVNEQNGTDHSLRSIIVGNQIYHGHDASILTTGTEYNAGIWLEHTDSALVEANTIRDMTHYGVTLSPSAGTNADVSFEVVGNFLQDCAGGIHLAGGSQNARINVLGGTIHGYSTGIGLVGASGIIGIHNVAFGPATSLQTSGGLILVDVSASTYPVKELAVTGCTKEANTYATDAADFAVFSAGTNLQTVTVANLVGDWGFVMRNEATAMRVQNCRIFARSSTYNAIRAATTRIAHCKLFVPATIGVATFALYGGNSVFDIGLEHCTLDGLTVSMATSNLANRFVVRGCTINNTQLQVQCGVGRIEGNYITDPPSNGAIRAGFINQSYEIHVLRNRVTGTSGNPLLQKWNFNPTRAVVVDNDVDSSFATVSGMTVTVFDSPKKRRTATATPVTVDKTDYYVMTKLATGAAIAVSLPSSPENGRTFVIKDAKGDAATNNITITPDSGTIDGASTKVINTNYGSVRLMSDGTNWFTV